MVIQCPECRTRFKLADEKLKPEGIKVRCARCKRVFAVSGEEPEMAPVSEIVPSPLSEAAVPSSAVSGSAFGAAILGGAPVLQHTPEDENWNDDPFAEADRPGLGDADTRPDGSVQEVETDDFFDFQPSVSNRREEAFPDFESSDDNTDPPFIPAPDPFGENSPSFPETASSSPDQMTVEVPEAEENPAFGFEADGPEEDPFGDEFRMPTMAGGTEPNGLPEEDDEFSFGAPLPKTEDTPPSGEMPEFGFDEGGRSDDFSFPEAETSAKDDLAWEPLQGGSDDLFAIEEPKREKDEFDFGDAGTAQESASAAMAAAPPASPPPVDPGPSLAPAAQPVLKNPAEESPSSRKGAQAEQRRRSKNPVSTLFLCLILLLLALAGAAAYYFWRGGPEEMARVLERFADPQPPPAAPSQIRLVELRGFFVQNSREGQLFVISGQAVNDHTEARSAISVKGILYDGKGDALLQQTVFAGNPLPEEALKQLPYSKIEEGMNNQFGDSLSNLNVAPGKSIPFAIVFKGLPPNLAEFTVEVADSRPGSKQ